MTVALLGFPTRFALYRLVAKLRNLREGIAAAVSGFAIFLYLVCDWRSVREAAGGPS